MQSFSFGSVSGSTFAFYFFLVIALFVGVAFYRILLEPKMYRIFGSHISRPAALTVGLGVALVVFLGIYFSALDGFYRLEIAENGQEVRLGYILPSRTLTLKRNEIAEIRRMPSYKTRWQLVLYTPAGARFASARVDYASTRKAWEYLNSRLNLQPNVE